MTNEIEYYHKKQKELYRLLDKNPSQAIKVAKRLSDDDSINELNALALKACIFVDGGAELGDRGVILEGIQIFEELMKSYPKRADLKQNLANGLVAATDSMPFTDYSWYLSTREDRARARSLYYEAYEAEGEFHIKGRSLANLGNALLHAFRFIEAYDYYIKATKIDPKNGVALTGASRVLIKYANMGIGDSKIQYSLAAQYLKTASTHKNELKELVGKKAFKKLEPLLDTKLDSIDPPDLSAAGEYANFVANHSLALSPTIVGLDPEIEKWDTLAVHSITEDISTESGVPPIFALFNVLKSDYLIARYLAYLGLGQSVPETGKYFDTLDYALYGINYSSITLAQRACYDLLDKIAATLSYYLEIPRTAKSTKFRNFWTKKINNKVIWKQYVKDELESNNTALVALSEVAYDLESSGFLQEKKKLRHSSTHGIIVLHDLGCEPSRKCRFIRHYEERRFINDLIESLQLARAAIFYLLEVISFKEHIKHLSHKRVGHLQVYDHDWVRGRIK